MTGKQHRIDLRLATQILLLQLTVVALTLGIAFALLAVVSQRRLIHEYGARSLDIARVVADGPAVREQVTRDNEKLPTAAELQFGPLQKLSEQVLHATGALFVVITNDQGIRLSHPNPAELGRKVSTEPSAALTGKEEVVQQTGTMGPSVRAKVPVFAPDSKRVVGQVSVGMSTSWVYSLLNSDLRAALMTGGPALLTGAVLSLLLARRWRKQTLDLQPTEMTELVRTQEAVLHGIGEGVLAADTDGNTTFVNDEARRLLEIGSATGQPVDQIGLTPRVLEVLRSCDPAPTLAWLREHDGWPSVAWREAFVLARVARAAATAASPPPRPPPPRRSPRSTSPASRAPPSAATWRARCPSCCGARGWTAARSSSCRPATATCFPPCCHSWGSMDRISTPGAIYCARHPSRRPGSARSAYGPRAGSVL